MRIEPVTDSATLALGAELFDNLPLDRLVDAFFAAPGHHLLFAWPDDAAAVDPLGFISGTEIRHPDKGTEMYLNELGVADQSRGAGVGTALVQALADRARAVGCTGMWGVTEPENAAARATYRRSAAGEETDTVLYAWTW